MDQMKVVVRYLTGKVLKGFTNDLVPNKDLFHLRAVDAPPGGETVVVPFKLLKAIFIVKDFAGHADHKEKNEFQPGKAAPGRKIEVTFKDGEHLAGVTQAYQPGRPNFYMIPADPDSNIERCLVFTAATKEVKLL